MIPVLDRFRARLVAVFRRSQLDADLDAEIAHHMEMLTDEYTQAGQSPAEARRHAKIAIGGLEQTRERHRAARSLPLLEQIGRDLRFSGRLLRREPGFAAISIALVAIGIGLNTTVFSLVNTVILRPLPFAEAERLVWISNGDPANPNSELSNISHLVDTWEGLAETSESLDEIEAYEPFSLRTTYRLTGQGEPETISNVMVSPGLFPLLGVTPILGRNFQPEDALSGSAPRVLITHQLWQRRYGSDPDIVGQTLLINDASVEIIGVLPPADGFTTSFYPAVRVDVYSALINENRRTWGNTLALIGRRKPGVALQEAAADLKRSVSLLQQQYPDRGAYYFANVSSLHDRVAGSLAQPLMFLWVAAAIFLAIVGFNLGGLLLSRGAARRKETALRAALGADRGRLLRQLLTETSSLVVVGSLLGFALAAVLVKLLSSNAAIEIPLLQTIRLDSASLGFSLLLCIATAVLCSIAPAWNLSSGKVNAGNALKEEGRSYTANAAIARARSGLVIFEVALACGLAISAALMARSFRNVLNIDLGFEPTNLIAVRIDPLVEKENLASYLESILDRVRAIPGVTSAGLTDCLPVERDRSWGISAMDNQSVDERRDFTSAHVRVVTPGLIGTMGTRLLEGRDFDRSDDPANNPGIIVNQSLARRFWPDGGGLDRFVSVGGSKPVSVIGIAEDVRHRGPETPAGNEMYIPMRLVGGSSWDLMVRTTLPLELVTAPLRDAMRKIDASLPLSQIRPVNTLVERTTSSRRLMVTLLGGFAALALALSAIGLYAVISYTVSQRTKEIGIRMALGADASAVRRDVVLHTLKLASWGLLIGVTGTLVGGQFMQSMLFGVSSFDPSIYITTTVVVLLCTLAAGYIPSRRASQIHPMQSLSAE